MIYLLILHPVYDIYTTFKSMYHDDYLRMAKKIRTVAQNSPAENIHNTQLDEALNPLITQYKVKNVTVVAGTMPSTGIAVGSALFTHTDKTIGIHKQFCAADMQAALCAAKHELGHIVHNHSLKSPLANTVCSIAICILFPQIGLTSLSGLIVGAITLLFMNCIYSKSIEAEADRFALEHATDEEIKGGIREFIVQKKLAENDKKKYFLLRFLPSFLESPFHPSIKSRIALFKAAYLKKTSQKYQITQEEKLKIESLEKYHTAAER